jgi:glyoxylase-like metal-dependent hydrolase (beta-lactamase superfamily II)
MSPASTFIWIPAAAGMTTYQLFLIVMTVSLIAPDVWRITTPLGSRPNSVHAYLAHDSSGRWMLVDGGADTDAAWEALDAGVREAAGGWQAISAQVITHMHLDHAGLAYRVADASGAHLAMGRLDAIRMVHAHENAAEEAEYRRSLLHRCAAPTELIEWAGRLPPASPVLPLSIDCLLADRTDYVPGIDDWVTISTPGHTAGHISAYRHSDRLLIAGDAVLPTITPTIGVNRQREDPIADYLQALGVLEVLRLTTVLPGHGDPITAPAARVAELIRETRAEGERLIALLGPEPLSTWRIVQARYRGRELPRPQQMQAVRETLAHLQHLAAAGAVRSTTTPDAVRFWHV